jgi:hypothetical protein
MPSARLVPLALAAGERDALQSLEPRERSVSQPEDPGPTVGVIGQQGRLRWLNWMLGLCS